MKKPIILCTVCLLASLAVMFFGFRDTKTDAPVKSRTLTLLTQEDTGSFLLQLRYGAQAAAAEAGDKLTNTTLNHDNPAGQIAELQTDGIAAVLFYGNDDALLGRVKAACADAGLPLTLLDREESGLCYAATDEELAGALAVRQARTLGAKQIVYLAGNSPVAAKRLRGAADEADMSIAALDTWYGWNLPGAALPETIRTKVTQGAYLIALTGDATLAAAQMKTDGRLDAQTPLIGMDPGSDRVTLIENTQATALILPAPYTMGYLGFQLAEGLLAGERTGTALVEPRLITLNNLYSAENVKIAFPLLQ